MPTSPKIENKGFAERLNAALLFAGYQPRGGGKRFAEKYRVKRPVVSEWRAGKYLPEYGKVREMAKEFGCSADWLYYGEGAAPEWFSGIVASPIFTKERRAADDLTAIQIGLESLTTALLQKTPGAAKVFLADIEDVASKKSFSTTAGFLAGLVDIAQAVQRAEAKVARAR